MLTNTYNMCVLLLYCTTYNEEYSHEGGWGKVGGGVEGNGRGQGD